MDVLSPPPLLATKSFLNMYTETLSEHSSLKTDAIWYHLYNLKNVKNTPEEVLLSVKWQALDFSLQLY